MFTTGGEDAQLFSFAGVIEAHGDDDTQPAVRTGIARALSRDQLVATLKSWGFQVTSVTGLDELKEAIGVLEAIGSGDPAIGEGDFVNFIGNATAPYNPDHVFTFLGEHATRPGMLFAGFAVAPSQGHLSIELASLMFDISSTLSLSEARALLSEMQTAGEGDDGFLDLVELAAQAA